MQTDNNDHWFLNGKKVVCNYLDHHILAQITNA